MTACSATDLALKKLSAMRKAPARGFPATEFEARTAKAQRLMAEAGIDALLFCTEPEVRYFSGFLTPFWQSPTRPWFLIVPREGKPVAVIPGIGQETMAATWIDDIRTWASPCPKDEGVSLLSDALRELGGKTIGVPMGEESALRMSLADFDRIREITGATFVDAGPIVRACRFVKSEAEIEKIAHICAVSSDAFDRTGEVIKAGMPLSEAFRAFRIELLAQGADEVPYLVDTGSTFDGYFCDYDRNYAIGHADEDAKAAYRTLYAATDAAFAAAKPGATCADLYTAMVSVIGDDGGGIGRFGHGLGTVLVPGMVLTLEPSMAIGPGKMMVHEENIVIREDGAHLLSRRADPELPVI